jgi:acyl carrier protein
MDGNASVLMIDFLKTKVLHNPSLDIHEDTPLVSSGLLDSFALIEVLLQLEKLTKCRIPAARVSPRDLDSVRQMFVTAERILQAPR